MVPNYLEISPNKHINRILIRVQFLRKWVCALYCVKDLVQLWEAPFPYHPVSLINDEVSYTGEV